MTQKRLLFLQAIASFCAGASLLYLILFFFLFFSNLRSFYTATLSGPWIEEGLKFLAVLLLLKLINIRAIIIPFVGVGFGLMELITHYTEHGLRNMFPFSLHFVFGLVMAYFFYLARKQKYPNLRSVLYALAFLIPTWLHLLYNTILAIRLI